MVDVRLADKTRWLSLSGACRLLEANEATVRQWGDHGHLRVYRTPGGHRRFFRDDVVALTQSTFVGASARRSPSPKGEGQIASTRKENLEGSTLRRIQRRLQHEDMAHQPWYQSIEEAGRARLRLFGRRLLSLLVQETPAGRRRQEALAESRMLGHEYGTEMADRGVELKDTIEAFIFFRTIVLGSATPRSWNQVLELADGVLVGVADAYQQRMDHPHPNLPPEGEGIGSFPPGGRDSISSPRRGRIKVGVLQ